MIRTTLLSILLLSVCACHANPAAHQSGTEEAAHSSSASASLTPLPAEIQVLFSRLSPLMGGAKAESIGFTWHTESGSIEELNGWVLRYRSPTQPMSQTWENNTQREEIILQESWQWDNPNAADGPGSFQSGWRKNNAVCLFAGEPLEDVDLSQENPDPVLTYQIEVKCALRNP